MRESWHNILTTQTMVCMAPERSILKVIPSLFLKVLRKNALPWLRKIAQTLLKLEDLPGFYIPQEAAP